MRVVVGERLGGPEVLSVAQRAAPRPGPGPGEIVVDVAAAGVNFMDIYQREGAGGYQTGARASYCSCPACSKFCGSSASAGLLPAKSKLAGGCRFVG
jgi:hypothetical protein